MEPDLIGIGTTPAFAIAQRALLLRRPEGNILWDCVTFLDDGDGRDGDVGLGGMRDDRDLPSALLQHHGRVGAGVRCRDPGCMRAIGRM
jgi:hypothetical protein